MQFRLAAKRCVLNVGLERPSAETCCEFVRGHSTFQTSPRRRQAFITNFGYPALAPGSTVTLARDGCLK